MEMKRIPLTPICGILILSACGGNPPLTQPTSVSVIDTSTPMLIPARKWHPRSGGIPVHTWNV